MDNYDFSVTLNAFMGYVNQLRDRDCRYLIYGAGIAGRLMARHLEDKAIAFVDRDTKFHGQEIEGLLVHPVSLIGSLEFDRLLISVLGREADIVSDLEANKLVNPGKVSWFDCGEHVRSFELEL